MSQLPAMPVWWGDYWSKTRRLSPSQHHAYLFLLGATWMNNGQPFADDDEVISGEIGISVSAWRKLRPALLRYFDLSGGTWRNGKLDEVWAATMQKVEKNRNNGALGGRPKKYHSGEESQQKQPAAKPNGSVGKTQPEPNQSHNQSQKEEDDANASSGTQTPAGASDARSSKRGTRLAVDWQPDEQDCEFAGSLGLGIGLGDVAAEFRDYWIAVPGAKGCKLDWSATFRNRCRDIAKYRGGNRAGQSANSGSGDSAILAALDRVRIKGDTSGYH